MKCDRCAARGVVTVSKLPDEGSPLVLQLCGHHTRENLDVLLAGGWSVVPGENVQVYLPGLDAAEDSELARV